jgi:hypothetical protein
MGELMEQTLEYLKRNYQNVSLIDLIWEKLHWVINLF